MRKTKQMNQELLKAQERLAEVEKLKIEAELEEKKQFDNIRQQIENIAEQNNMFCGIILSTQDIVAVIDIAFKTGEAVKIPFNIYYKNE